MRKTSKLLALAISAIMLFGVLTACGGQTTGAGSQEKVTIKFASWSARGNAVNSKDYIDYFQEANPNIKIDFMAITEGNYQEKLTTMVAAKTAPDVMLAWECFIGEYAKNKSIIQLDDYIKKTNAFKVDDLVPAVTVLGQQTGGTFGLPWCMAAELAYYNKDMFDKAGVAYPKDDWTWKDFEDMAKKLTIVQDGKTVQWGADAISFQGIWYSTIGATGENIIDKDNKVVLGEGAKKALQWEYDLTNTLKVCPPPSASGTNAVDLFSAGKAAMTRTGNWMIGTYMGIKDFKWDIVPLPKDSRQYTTTHTGLYCISADSKYKDAAWKFIEYSMGDKGQEEINKQSSNASARKSITAKGFYKVTGANGSPTNWKAYEDSLAFGQFGYAMANSGVTNAGVSNFNAALMGQMTVDEAIQKTNDEANKVAAP